MPLLTDAQKDKIAELVKLHHQALVVEILGEGAVSKAVLARIKTQGLYRKPKRDVFKSLFTFGREGVINHKVLKMSAIEFEDYLDKKGVLLEQGERDALMLLHRSFSNYMKSLGEDLESKIGQAILKADRLLQRKLSARKRPSLFMEVERRKAVAALAKDLADATEQQVGNASRVVVTETNNAYQEGRASEILRKAGGGDPVVFKRPRHDACDECKKAYLDEDGVTPKLFRMSALVENGSNIGKSRADRQPVIDSFHPHCACELQWLPPGFSFNADGEMEFHATSKRSA